MTLVQTLRRLGVYAAAALLVTAVSIKPVTVYAMGTDSPPPADDSKKKKKKKDNNRSSNSRNSSSPRRNSCATTAPPGP